MLERWSRTWRRPRRLVSTVTEGEHDDQVAETVGPTAERADDGLRASGEMSPPHTVRARNGSGSSGGSNTPQVGSAEGEGGSGALAVS